MSSDRTFGLTFAGLFALVGAWPLMHKHPFRPWALGFAGAFLLISLLMPRLLHLPNIWWTHLGKLLGKVTNPIVAALMFYLFVTPIALIFKLLGKDPLRLTFDRAAESYWILREPSSRESMRNQF